MPRLLISGRLDTAPQRLLVSQIAAAVIGLLVFVFWITAIIVVGQGKIFLAGDNEIFASTSFFHRVTGELANPLYDPLLDNSDHRILWHGWFMPWLQSILTPTKNYEAFYVSCVIISFFSILLYCLSLKNESFLKKISIVLTISVVLFYQWGRPELVISAIISIFLVIQRSQLRSSLTDGLLLGLCMCTSPTAGVSLCLLWAISVTADQRPSDFVKYSLSTGLVVLGTVVLATSFIAQFDMLTWILGVIEHAAIIGARPPSGSYLRYYFAAPEFLGLFAYILLGALILLDCARDCSRLRQVLCILFVVWLLTRLQSPHAVYNVIALIPVALFAHQTTSIHFKNSSLFQISRLSIFLLVTLLSTLTISRNVLLNIDLIGHGVSASHMAASIDALGDRRSLDTTSLSVAARLAFVPGVVDRDVSFVDQSLGGDRIETQAFTGLLGPVEVGEGEYVILDRFHLDRPNFLGIPLGRTRKDWAFALIRSGTDLDPVT